MPFVTLMSPTTKPNTGSLKVAVTAIVPFVGFGAPVVRTTVGIVVLRVTVLSVELEDVFGFEARSVRTPAAIEAITVPSVVTGTVTVYVRPEPDRTATPWVAVPPSVTSLAVKPVTGSLKTTVKSTLLPLVGSAWPTAWLIVTDGGVVSVTPLTFRMAVPVAVPLVPVTVWGPAVRAEQLLSVHVPPAIPKPVVDVLSPRALP